MRQAGTVSNEQDAHRFADYLLMLGVSSRVISDDGRWVVWVHDETKVDQAREELDRFLGNPQDERYAKAHSVATEVRRQEEQETRRAQKNVIDVRAHWQRPVWQRAPLTVALMVVSVLASLGSNFGQRYEGPRQWLHIVDYKSLEREINADPTIVNKQAAFDREVNSLVDVRRGQLWRLVTPIFLHFSSGGLPLHLFFNMYMLYMLGPAVETRHGTWRYALLVLTIAIASNLMQLWMVSPLFGGMSGVVYGLFGYIWMRAKFDPFSGFVMPQQMVLILVAWFFLGVFGVIPHLANWAHGVGLGVGMLIGYLAAMTRHDRYLEQ